jgi:hypothetical protein
MTKSLLHPSPGLFKPIGTSPLDTLVVAKLLEIHGTLTDTQIERIFHPVLLAAVHYAFDNVFPEGSVYKIDPSPHDPRPPNMETFQSQLNARLLSYGRSWMLPAQVQNEALRLPDAPKGGSSVEHQGISFYPPSPFG